MLSPTITRMDVTLLTTPMCMPGSQVNCSGSKNISAELLVLNLVFNLFSKKINLTRSQMSNAYNVLTISI